MRIGIHHKPILVGTFGCAERSDYKAVGATVNMASRIEGRCKPGAILVSQALCDFLPESMAVKAGEFELKGVAGIHNLYRLVA